MEPCPEEVSNNGISSLAKEEQLEKNIDSDSSNPEFIKHLEIQLESLDDNEFQLPPVHELPTLESILNEDRDDDPGSISDNETNFGSTNILKPSFSVEGGDTASVMSKGSSDSKSRVSAEPKHSTKKETKSNGSILRHVVLKGLTTQLISAHERVGAGLPSTMAIGNMICVGTSHGLILVFEPSQALKWCLGSTQQGEEHGAVSAIALNQDCSKLLAGYAKGLLCLFDLTNGKLLQNIPDAHTPFTAVLHIKWTDYPGLTILSDSGGSVFELSLKRTMGMNLNESRCIFSGSRGEVCTIEPLIMGHFLSLPPVIDTVIVAMATISKMIVVALRPHLKVLFSHPLKGSSSTLPLLSWQFVIIQMPDGTKVIDPVLAFGREKDVYFYQLTHGTQDELTFIPLQRMSVVYTLQALEWLNSRTISVIDTQERLHVIDVKNQEELDMVDLVKLGLVYASSHFKAIATGGNVSKAMTVGGERACYHSMVTFGSQVLLLGTKSFQVVTMRTWEERIDHMVKGNHIGEAMLWALDILNGKAQAVIGLTHKKSRREQLLKDKIHGLLEIYLEKSMLDLPDRSNINQLIAYYQIIVSRCVKVAVEADFKDYLFEHIWDTFFDDPLSRGIFLESLEPYLLDDRIVSMSPSISQYLLSHYEDKGRLQAIEACIVHLDIPSLDLHQTMTLCWNHSLYDAIFYVYTKGMNDYVTPLEELLTVLKNALDSNDVLSSTPQVALGNKILVYVSCCLAGRAYPHQGEIESELLQKVKHEVFKSLTSLHTKGASEDERPYPYLRTLLRFDTREFLNVLSLAFEEKEFTSELGLIQRQRVVDLLLQVMTTAGPDFSSVQLGSLFTFVARQICRQQRAIATDRHLVKQVLDHLCDPNIESHHEERQSALLELFQVDILKEYDQKDLLSKAEEAGFYRVCEYLYGLRGSHELILACYTKDKMRRHQVFSYIRTTLVTSNVPTNQRDKLKKQIVNEVQSLFQIDSIELAKQLLTIETMVPLILEIAEKLHKDHELLFEFLQALFASRSSLLSTVGDEDECSCDNILFPELQEMYLDLMGAKCPNQVASYLLGAQGYRLNETLQICLRHNLDEATAYLLEKKGDLKAAFDIHLQILKSKSEALTNRLDSEDCGQLTLALENVQTQVNVLVRVCQLCSSNLDEDERRDIWFPFLDSLLALQPPFANRNGTTQEVRGIIGRIVNCMMAHISLPSILERIMKDPGYSDCNFGQIKHLLKDMVERYIYEETLYSTVIRMIQGDQLRYLDQMKSQMSLPLTINVAKCSLCRLRYHPDSRAMAFSCGHSYHVECGGEETVCVVCSGVTGHVMVLASTGDTSDTKDKNKSPKMNKSQLEGLERISVLDDHTSRLSLLESLNTKRPSRSRQLQNLGESGDPDHIFTTKNFALQLSPPTFIHELDDI